MDEQHQQSGPAMIAATKVLKKQPIRIGKITDTIILPRSIPLSELLAGVGSLMVTLPLFLLFPFGPLITRIIFALAAAGALGMALVRWKPSKGESLLGYLTVLATSRVKRKTVSLDGDELQLSIGIAPISHTETGRIRLVPGAVNIHPENYDERGVLRSAKNQNLEDGGGAWTAPFTIDDEPSGAVPGDSPAP